MLSQRAGFRDPWDLAGFMWANALRLALFSFAAAFVLGLPCLLRARGGSGISIAALGCLLLAAVDPLQANGSFMTQGNPSWLKDTAPAVKYLQADTEVFRIARFGRRLVLHPNLSTVYGLQDTGGYDSIILDRYARYLEAVEPQRALWSNQIRGFEEVESLDSPLFSLLNIRYLICDLRESVDHPDWQLVFSEGMNIYRNRRERPRAFMVHQAAPVGSFGEILTRLAEGKVDPAKVVLLEGPAAPPSGLSGDRVAASGQASIATYEPTAVELATSSEAPGIAVLCDMMYPGWKAYLDGRPVEVLKADGIFRGVYVPPGKHRIWFRFEPASLRRGAVLLLCGVAMLGGLVVLSRLPTASRSVG